jgi:asparagine synthase (glutamine-hydrolysing)
MTHRGPDGGGVHVAGPIALGHRRLAIIDLEGGAQPLSYRHSRFWITYNGEIYNYRELRAELTALGCEFLTHSDTEVILAAYATWGTACLAKLNGIFAFGLWDATARRLLLARDHLGVKPLLYHHDRAGIRFGSELKGLLAHPAVRREVNPEALQDYLALGYVMAPNTIIRGVSKLPPGHFLEVREGRPTLTSFWDLKSAFLDTSLHNTSRETLTQRFDALLGASVKAQMVSDVPVAAFLSGGLDSTSVVYFAARERPLLTFSMGFREASYSELDYAREAARGLGTEHHDGQVEPESLDAISRLVWYYDEPLGDTSIIPTYYVSRLARQYVKVVLSGDGADEILAGYDTYIADLAQRYYARLPRWVHQRIILPATSRIGASDRKVTLGFRVRQFVAQAAASAERAHYGWRQMFGDADRPALSGYQGGYDPFSSFSRYYDDVQGAHWLQRSLYVDIKTWLADDILAKVDRASMANGLESRVPFLAPELVEFAARLPPDMKLHGLTRKHVLRRVMRRRIPERIRSRTKRGFNAPVSVWLRDHQAAEVEALFRRAGSTLVDLKAPVVRRLWEEHRLGLQDHGFKLWNLLSLLLWEKQVLVGGAGAP